jgi:predicted PurR-regulated permease PerM
MNNLTKYGIVSIISVLLILLLFMMTEFIGSIVLGLFIYYSTEPVYKKLRYYDIRKSISAISAILSIIIPVLVVLSYTIRIIAIEVRALTIELRSVSQNIDLGPLTILERESVSNLLTNISNLGQIKSVGDLEQIVQSFDVSFVNSVIDVSIESILILTSSLSNIFFSLFIAFAIAYYCLKDGEHIKNKVYDMVDYEPNVIKFWEDLDKKLQIVFLGNLGLALITSIIGIISYTLVGVLIPGGGIIKYPALIGILCGLSSIIPVFGAKIIYLPITVILYIIGILNFGIPFGLIFPTVFILVSSIIVDFIPDLVIRPMIGSMGGVSMGVVLLSFVLGPLTFGWYGLFLGPLIFVTVYEFINELLPHMVEIM